MEAAMEPCVAPMPICLAFPCCCCALPGTICQLCGYCFCNSCSHACDREPPVEEDVEDEIVACTCGSDDDYFDQNIVFNKLKKLLTERGWTQYEY